MSTNILRTIDIKSILSIGLDVCKTKIDICLVSDKNHFLKIKNNKKGISEFITILMNNGFCLNTPIIIESTGDYNTLACILFSEEKFNIKEINPLITKKYIKSTIRGTKTDKTDAKALADIGLINKNELFTYTKTKKFISINKKISLISSLEKQIQSLKMIIKSFKEVNNNLEITISSNVIDIKITIQELEEKIKILQNEIVNDKIDEIGTEKIKIISSITGISDYIAKIIYCTFAYKDFISKKSMYAFVGYDPKLKESGNMKGNSRISKRGNAYVRKKLFQAAFGAVRHCNGFKEIYSKAKEKGKHHFVALNMVIKKMVHIIFSLLKNNTYFKQNFGQF